MERKEVNEKIYHLSHGILDGRTLELTMRSLAETEKNIWRLDLALLREEIKASYFYAPKLSDAFMDSLKGRAPLPEQIRCELLLGLVVRNPHWSVVEEEFLRLYGALQIGPDIVFSDTFPLRDLYCFQHRGEIKPQDLAGNLEGIKGLETKRILAFYQPASWKEWNQGKQGLEVEKSRIKKIQQMMADEASIGWPWMDQALEEATGGLADQANRWRVMMDQLQRRERTGATNAEIRKAKVDEMLNHRSLGPVKVIEIRQEAGAEVWDLKGLLRSYHFRYEKKR